MKQRVKKYKGLLVVLILCVVVEMISVTSYAFFNYEQDGEKSSSLATGNINVDYEQLHDLGPITNMLKRSTYDSNTYVGFSITGRNTSTNTVYYYITLNEGDASNVNDAVRIRDDLLKFKLVSFPTRTDYDNDTNGTDLFSTTDHTKDFGALDNTIIRKGVIATGTENDTTTYYKLYVWIKNDLNLCGEEGPGCDYYTINQYPKWNNVYATIKVGVNANFENKFGNNYEASSLYDLIKTGAVNDGDIDGNGKAIDFGKANYYTENNATVDNGNGKFVLRTTTNDTYPIYYYRGDAKIGTANELKNNVAFAGFCWKIVRTTETGGIKMIYNGEYNASTGCPTVTGDAARGVTSIKEGNKVTFQYSLSDKSLAYMGYSYTNNIKMQNGNIRTAYEWVANAKPDAGTPVDDSDDTSVIFGTDVSYDNGVYTLINTDVGIATTRHYTCNSTDRTTSCSNVRYYYIYDITTNYYLYIELEGGDNIDDALNNMLNKKTDTASNAQTVVNNWYDTKIKSNYDNYVEDTIWCMERNRAATHDGWGPAGGINGNNYLWLTSFRRITLSSDAIKLKCDGTLTYGSGIDTNYYPNRDESVDQLYYGYGSGNIGSKAALLTYDEMKLIGLSYRLQSITHNYLYTGYSYWLLSPTYFYTRYSTIGKMGNNGTISEDSGSSYQAIIPVLSLNHSVQTYGGTGTVADPYIVTES